MTLQLAEFNVFVFGKPHDTKKLVVDWDKHAGPNGEPGYVLKEYTKPDRPDGACQCGRDGKAEHDPACLYFAASKSEVVCRAFSGKDRADLKQVLDIAVTRFLKERVEYERRLKQWVANQGKA